MSELSDEDKRILAHLRERTRGGERYFRAKHVADAIGLTAKQVGARLARLAEGSAEDGDIDVDVEIEKWSRARSTTWRVTPE